MTVLEDGGGGDRTKEVPELRHQKPEANTSHHVDTKSRLVRGGELFPSILPRTRSDKRSSHKELILIPETILTKPRSYLARAISIRRSTGFDDVIMTNIGAIGRVPPRQMPDVTHPKVVWYFGVFVYNGGGTNFSKPAARRRMVPLKMTTCSTYEVLCSNLKYNRGKWIKEGVDEKA
eukprot:scaffold40911_cov222-Skeletonema_dohrnii-CCMP3373.AAC.1